MRQELIQEINLSSVHVGLSRADFEWQACQKRQIPILIGRRNEKPEEMQLRDNLSATESTPNPALAEAVRATSPDRWRAKDAYDTIVVGGGATGGLAAMILCRAGQRVLLLDAGLPRPPDELFRNVYCKSLEALLDGPGRRFLPRVIGNRGWRTLLRAIGRSRQPVQSQTVSWEHAPQAFVDDKDCPYVNSGSDPFMWIRSRALGGRLVVPGHGRQYYRLGSWDFASSHDPNGAWPLRPDELDPCYAWVERWLSVKGTSDGLPWLPDSELVAEIPFTPMQSRVSEAIRKRWPNAKPIPGRFAVPPMALEAAAQSGNLLCRQGAIVKRINVDSVGKVTGVVWIDTQTGREEKSEAQIVFLGASALETTRLLLLSGTSSDPTGLGARSGVLGRFLMDHVMVSAVGKGAPLPRDAAPKDGECIYLPRFDSRDRPVPARRRGFGVQLNQFPENDEWSHFMAIAFGEMAPRRDNLVRLDDHQRDAWGIPVLNIRCSHGEEDLALAKSQNAALVELSETLNVKLTSAQNRPMPPGLAIHECGTARMGSDPASSVFDPHSECWDAKGLYVTDGACFPSQGTQNPTLTMLALTVRACARILGTTVAGIDQP
jgi:choline dehydrogenase-like flavoprotein